MMKLQRFHVIGMIIILLFAGNAWSGNKKIMSIRAAENTASRALVESIYGLKIRSTEAVQDMVASSFVGKSETKTSARISGIKIEERVYDPDKDIAKVTVSVSMDNITNIDGQVMDLKGKEFRRVGFGTSSPKQAGPLKALRAAEIDAYVQLSKRLTGFSLESGATVENFILKSDFVKTKVLSTLYLAQLTDYGWEKDGNAFVKLALNVRDVEDILGEKIKYKEDLIEVEGYGSQTDDLHK